MNDAVVAAALQVFLLEGIVGQVVEAGDFVAEVPGEFVEASDECAPFVAAAQAAGVSETVAGPSSTARS